MKEKEHIRNKYLSVEDHIKDGHDIDPITGFRYEYWDVGMTRNAKPENKKRLKVYLDPSPHVVLDQHVPLRGWYKSKFENPRVRNRPCYTEALLTSPYGGTCPVRCQFCYVNNGQRGYRGQGLTVVDPQYPDKIAKQLDSMKFGWNAYISSFTEPFQKLEGTYHITQRLSEEITKRGLPLFYLSRMIPPDWAVDYLSKSKYSYMQFSITTSDRDDSRKISPGAATIDEYLECIRDVLKPQGIYVSIQCNPIMPGITSNEKIIKLIRELAAVGTDHIIFKFVEIVTPAAPDMISKAKQLFGSRGDEFASLFTDNIGGMRTIREDYRINALKLFKEETTRVGMTMSTCYEYGYERNEDGSIKNKTGISIGQRFTTSEQCHGQRTPIHIKNEITGLFEPFEGCPSCGCLYCNDIYPNNPPCKSLELQQAKALPHNIYSKKLCDLNRDIISKESLLNTDISKKSKSLWDD